MSTSDPSRPRGRRAGALAGAAVAALAAGALIVTGSLGSSHREAPLSSLDPATDDTDLYAFTAPDAPRSLTVVANWVPFEDPGGGPSFYHFDNRARYYINGAARAGTGAPRWRRPRRALAQAPSHADRGTFGVA